MKKSLHAAFMLMAGSSLFLAADVGYGVSLYSTDLEEPKPRQSEIIISFADPSIRDDANPAVVADFLGIEDQSSYGIESLYWTNDPDADWKMYLDGKFMFRPDDFSLSFEAFVPDEKIFKLEIQHWENYDYGAGVYYPARNSYFTLDPDLLKEEISRIKVSYQFNPSYETSWKVSYSMFERSGSGLSTSFGDDFQYLLTSPVKSRGVVPSLVEGEETIHRIDLEYKNQDEVERKGIRLHYQKRESDKTRISERSASNPATNRFSTQKDASSDDLFGFSAFRRKQVTDSIYGSVGVAFTRLDGDITGSRVFGANPEAQYDIDFAATQFDDRGFLDLEGTRQLRQWIINANAVYDPEGSYRWMAGVRYERLSTETFSSYFDNWDTFDYLDRQRQDQEALMTSASSKKADDLSAFLEVRYKGFSKASLYSRVEAGQQDGDLSEDWLREELLPNPAEEQSLLDRATDFNRTRAFWEAGINYYPTSSLRFSIKGYVKSRENEYDYENITLVGYDRTRYPGFIEEQEFYTEDVNARVHWKVFPWLKSVSRVDLQNTTVDSKTYGKQEVQSADRERIVFNQTLVFTPHPRIFLNASYQLVDDLTETPASEIQQPFDGIIVNLPNDYWQFDLNAFIVLASWVDMQVGYHYLEMSNYLDTSPKTVPYGSDLEQHRGSLDLILHISESYIVRAGYHYYEQTDLASNGNLDYKVHLIKTSFQLKF